MPAGPGGIGFTLALGVGTADSQDFTVPNLTGVIGPGETSTTVTVVIRGDVEVEPDETFRLEFAQTVGATARTVGSTYTIINDDGLPPPVGGLPNMSVSDGIITEGDTGQRSMIFSINLSAPAPVGGASVTFSTADGTATAGSDYTARSATVTIPAGSRGVETFALVLGDTAVEGNEQFTVNLSGAAGATIVDGTGIGTIIDDDIAGGGLPTLNIAPVTAAEGNAGITPFGFNVTLSAPAGPGGATFTATVTPGSATQGTDYNVPVTTSFTIPQGSTSTTVPVQVIGDTVVELDENFTVTLSNPVGAVAGTMSATGTILNDDTAGFTVSIEDFTAPEGFSGTSNFDFIVRLSAPAPAGGYTFTANATGSTAFAPDDFTLAPNTTVTIPAGSTTGVVRVSVVGDTVFEPNETFFVSIQSAPGQTGATIVRGTATGTIVNDDPLPLTLSIADASVTEGNAGTVTMAFMVTLSGPAPTGGVGFDFTTSDGTALAGSDYTQRTLQGQTVPSQGNFIPAGMTSIGVIVTVLGDTIAEGNEFFNARISSPTQGVLLGTSQARGTIVDDDVPVISIADVTVAEGNSGSSNAVLTVQLNTAAPPGGVRVDVQTTTFAGAPPAGTTLAIAGQDYTAISSTTVTIPAGAQSATVPVAILGDTLHELDEVFTINLFNPVGATISRATATATITNDDTQTFTISSTSVVERDSGETSPAVLTVTRTPSAVPTEISVAVGGGTAAPNSDYQSPSIVRLQFSGGTTTASLPITILGDDVLEPDETVLATLQPGAGYLLGAASVGTVTIQNDDVDLVFSPATLPAGRVRVAFNQTITATGGTAPYRFELAQGALPPGLTLQTDGTLSGTPTAGGTFNFVVTASGVAPAPIGPFVDAATYTLTIADGQVVLPSATLPSATLSRAYQAGLPAATGGTAPYRYEVTGGALPAGITLDRSTGALSGTPTAIGAFSFTVTATDSSTGTGPYRASQTYALQVNGEPPIAANSTLTVAYNAAPVTVPLVLSGGVASSVAVVTAPANGSATVNGTTITYQPRAGFSGTDGFTYTASNAGGTSAPATVTVTVRAPEFTVTSVGELAGTAGVPYSLTFEFAGGTAPFSGYQVTGLPAGVSITASTANAVTVSGTPTAVGSFAIEVSARDSSTGDGPFTVVGTATLTMAPPVLVLQPSSAALSASYGTAYSQVFTASGGSGSFSYAQTGTLPPGLTFNTTTGTLSGTPTASGSFSFTVTATDRVVTGAGAPFRVARTFTLAVAAPVITVTPTTLPGATAGRAYSATLVGAGAIGPYSFTLADGRLPAGITLSSTGVLSGTPTASGSFPLVLRVRDANGETGTVNLTLTVAVPTLTITPTVLQEANQGLAYTQTITATGGIAPYTYAVTAGALPEGLSLNATTGVISGTPLGSGAASFTITVTDSTGGTAARASVAYVLQIAPRPDPARDPEVQGLTQSQVQSVRRMSDAQIGNFRNRLGWLRPGNGGGGGGGSGGGASLASGGGFHNGVRIMAMDPCAPKANSWSVSPCARALGSAGVHGLSGFGAGPFQLSVGADGAAGASAAADGGSAPATGGNGVERPWSVWASGTIRYGDIDPQTGVAAQSFEADGLTLGADYRYNDRLAVGVGLGFGNDIVTVGTNGSRSRTQAVTAASYGSYLLGGGYFADWVVGYQWLDLELRRFVTSTGGIVRSNRSGNQLFLSASAGSDIDVGSWRISPYGRFDIARGSLDAYRENSGSLFDLSYGEQSLDYAAVGVGSTFEMIHAFEGGLFRPQLSVEYLYDLDRQEAARVGYVERSNGAFSTIALTGIDREQLSVGLGFEVQWDTGSSVGVDYLTRFSSGIGSDETWQLNARFQF